MKLCCLFLCALSLTAQVAREANRGYTTEGARAGVAASLGAHDRDARQQPEKLIAALGLQPGQSVADVGTGVGYMLPFLSAAVGASGKVYAEDIFPDFLRQARQRATDRKLSNIAFVAGDERDPHLPPKSLDLALVLDVYHHFDYPAEMLAHLKASLKPTGRLALVDYYKSAGSMPGKRALTHIRLDEPDVIKEVEQHGFRLVKRAVHLPDVQYLLLFEKAA